MLPILTTTENAFASASSATLTSASLTANVYTGIDNENKAAPAVICSCVSAEEDFPSSGIWHVKSSIMVKEMAADTSVTSSLANTIFNKIIELTNTELANCTSNFAVYDFWLEGHEQTQQDDAWIQVLNLQVIATLT